MNIIYNTLQKNTVDISVSFLYIICSGCAVESRDAHSPGSSCVGSLFATKDKIGEMRLCRRRSLHTSNN